MKLWQVTTDLDVEVERYTVGEDYITDQRLVRWDCLASIAHAAGLVKIGVLNPSEYQALRQALTEIMTADAHGRFSIRPQDEDCHTAIENALVEKLGEVGKKIHTARSRNDQVLVALKLYMRQATLELNRRALEYCSAVLEFAQANPVPFPGYTHLQRAMPSTVSLWAASFAESMLDNVRQLRAVHGVIDCCPLGSAAGYGVAFDLDREYVAKLLGFARVQNNVLYVQNARGKNEAQLLAALGSFMLDLNKLATDLILFSTPEFGYLELPAKFCTGSSIMPQKKNPDVPELVRARAKLVMNLATQVQAIVSDLPSGYNRDFQLTKKPLLEGFDQTCSTLVLMTRLVAGLKVNSTRCAAALSPDIFAADMANEYVKQGMAFRDAYRKVKEDLVALKIQDPKECIATKRYSGAPGNPGLELVAREIKTDLGKVEQDERALEEVVSSLISSK